MLRLVAIVFAAAMVNAGVAAAQEANISPPAAPLTPEEIDALGGALMLNPAIFADGKPAKPLRLPALRGADTFDVSHSDNADGSRSMKLKQPLASDWDAKVGADLNFAAAPSREGLRPLTTTSRQDSGVAWVSAGVPNFASVDARLNPGSDQGTLGTTLKHSIPVGRSLSLTLQDSFSVTQTFSVATPAATADVPLMTAPPAGAAPDPQVWGDQKSVKFDLLSTGTSFGAGLATASNDPLTHSTLSAEQKLFGPLHVTTAVTDFGKAGESKSITAGIKLNW